MQAARISGRSLGYSSNCSRPCYRTPVKEPCRCIRPTLGAQRSSRSSSSIASSNHREQQAQPPASSEQQQQQQQQQQQTERRKTADLEQVPTRRDGPQQERDLVVPILVAICLAGYALIAVLGFVDSLDTQQNTDWQL